MSPTRRRAYIAWVIVCIVWGTTYLAIRVALESIPPMLMAAMRWIAAGSVLILWLKGRGERLPGPRAWPALTVLGTLLLGFGNGAVVWAEQTVASGLTAVLVATVPFWMVGVEAVTAAAGRSHAGAARADSASSQASDSESLRSESSLRRERVTARQLVGLVAGFAGIVILVWPEIRLGESGRAFLAGVTSTQVAALGWAVGSTYARRRGRTDAQDENVLATAAFEMLFGGVVLLIVGIALGETSRLTFTTRTSLALAHLTFFGAIAGFTAYAYALKHLPIATVSLYAYINPIIAVVLGTLMLREPFSIRMAIAAAIVLVGVALVRE